MTDKELQNNLRIFASIHGVDIERCRPVPKSELMNGITYQGRCRNTTEAIWDVDKFVYIRHKFGSSYPEEINHYEDDDGYDVFIPIEIN